MPMTLVDARHGRRTSISDGLRDMVKYPFNARAGQTNIAMMTNPAAHVVVGARPKFCIARAVVIR
jgi:hypothetical protein